MSTPSPLEPNPTPQRVLDYIRPMVGMVLTKWDTQETLSTKLSTLQSKLNEMDLPVIELDWHIDTDPKRVTILYTIGGVQLYTMGTGTDTFALEDKTAPK